MPERLLTLTMGHWVLFVCYFVVVLSQQDACKTDFSAQALQTLPSGGTFGLTYKYSWTQAKILLNYSSSNVKLLVYQPDQSANLVSGCTVSSDACIAKYMQVTSNAIANTISYYFQGGPGCGMSYYVMNVPQCAGSAQPLVVSTNCQIDVVYGPCGQFVGTNYPLKISPPTAGQPCNVTVIGGSGLYIGYGAIGIHGGSNCGGCLTQTFVCTKAHSGVVSQQIGCPTCTRSGLTTDQPKLCATSDTYNLNTPVDTYTGSLNGKSVTCTGYKPLVSTGSVQELWVVTAPSSSGLIGSVCQYKDSSNSMFTFTTENFAAVSFPANLNCTCNRKVDLTIAIEGTASADIASISTYLQSFFGQFTISTTALNVAFFQFSSTVKSFGGLSAGTSLSGALAQLNSVGCSTGSCGSNNNNISAAIVAMQKELKNSVRYSYASKVMLVITKTQTSIPSITQTAAANAQAAIPGLNIYAFGVGGPSGDYSPWLAITNNNKNNINLYYKYATISNDFADTFAATVCSSQSTPCGSCSGVCDECNPSCVPPTSCSPDGCYNYTLSNGACVQSAFLCNPSDRCHTSTCQNNRCVEQPVDCPADDGCYSWSCDGKVGCVRSVINFPTNKCNTYACTNNQWVVNTSTNCKQDNSLCIDYGTCEPTTGDCPTPVQIPCTTSSGIPCSQDQCNKYTCAPQTGWVPTPTTSCTPRDKCDSAQCYPDRGCVHTPIICGNSSDLCDNSYCDNTTGCVVGKVTCAPYLDGDHCKPLTSCSPTAGCQYGIQSCPQVGCTLRTCNSSDGKCYNTSQLCSCTMCGNVGTCGTAKCNSNNCHITANQAICSALNDYCTTYTCNASFECEPTQIQPNFLGNSCIKVIKDPTTPGCYKNQTIDCTDPCYNTECTTICTKTTPKCTSDDLCKSATCIPENGTCVLSDITCSDDPARCLLGRCENGQCGYVDQCIISNITCVDNVCDGNGNCVKKLDNGTCDDGNACTLDICTENGCTNTPITCFDDIACTEDQCDITLGCLFIPSNNSCDDNNLCTIDTCSRDRGCVYEDFVCNETMPCSETSCDPTLGCIMVPLSCSNYSESSSCSVVYCDSSIDPVSQPDSDLPAGCVKKQNECFSSITAAVVGSTVTTALIVGIVLAVTVFSVAGGGAAAIYQRQEDDDNSSIKTSPLYVSPTKGGDNPLYSPDPPAVTP